MKTTKLQLFLLLLVGLSLTTVVHAQEEPPSGDIEPVAPDKVSYNITEIKPLNTFTRTDASGISDNKVVAVRMEKSPNGAEQYSVAAFFYKGKDSTLKDLGVIGAGQLVFPTPDVGGVSYNGQLIVGSYFNLAVNDQPLRAFAAFTAGKPDRLFPLPGITDVPVAKSAALKVISFSIAGWADDENQIAHAALWETATLKLRAQLPELGADKSSEAYDSYRGVTVGVSCREDCFESKGPFHAVSWKGKNAPSDLGKLIGATSSFAVAINFKLDILGTASLPDVKQVQGALWPGTGEPFTFGCGARDAHPVAINSLRQAVGSAGGKAVLWNLKDGAGARCRDLNEMIDPKLGWTLQFATGITEDGFIVGNGELNGDLRGFVLEPIK